MKNRRWLLAILVVAPFLLACSCCSEQAAIATTGELVTKDGIDLVTFGLFGFVVIVIGIISIWVIGSAASIAMDM